MIPSPDPESLGFAIVLILMELAMAIAVYLLPWFIARGRGVTNRRQIGWITLLLGWTVIGWALALGLALRPVPLGHVGSAENGAA